MKDPTDPKRFRLLATLLGFAIFFGTIAVLGWPLFVGSDDPPVEVSNGNPAVDAARVRQWAAAIRTALEQYRREHAGMLPGISDGPITPHLDRLGFDRRVFLADFARPDGTLVDEFRLEDVRSGSGEWTLVVRSDRTGVAFRQPRTGPEQPLQRD